MLKRIVILLIQVYQKIFTPIYQGFCEGVKSNFRVCNFYPSCSEYAILAFRKYTFKIAFLKTIDRLKRCNGKHGGIDFP